MSTRCWPAAPYVVHLTDASGATDLERRARDHGASVFHLPLRDAQDRRSLGDLLARAFLFPHAAVGIDAAVDLISDLEWLANAQGYLVVSDLSEALPQVVTSWAEVLPAIIDRWRSQGTPFSAVLVGGDSMEVAVAALSRANHQLERAGRLAWAQPGTGPIEIIDHRSAHEA
jgi:hypothetical protein